MKATTEQAKVRRTLTRCFNRLPRKARANLRYHERKGTEIHCGSEAGFWANGACRWQRGVPLRSG